MSVKYYKLGIGPIDAYRFTYKVYDDHVFDVFIIKNGWYCHNNHKQSWQNIIAHHKCIEITEEEAFLRCV